MIFIGKIWAFLWRDFIHELSYKLAFLLQLFSIFVTILIFFFLAKLVDSASSVHLQAYGGNYFSFVLIGIAFFSYLDVSMRGLTNSIRDGQKLGTLEALLVTQTEIPIIIVASSLYSFVWATFKVAVYLALGSLLMGIDLGQANLLSVFIVLVLTILSFGSLGIISASFVMVLKKGDPIGAVFTSLSSLLGGLYYPITVLPDWLQIISYLLPITYALECMRLALLKGFTPAELMPGLGILLFFSIVLLPLSLLIFNQAVKRSKRDGTLTQY